MRYLIKAVTGPHPSWWFRGGNPQSACAWSQSPDRARSYLAGDVKRTTLGMTYRPRKRKTITNPSKFAGMVIEFVPVSYTFGTPTFAFKDTPNGKGEIVPITYQTPNAIFKNA